MRKAKPPYNAPTPLTRPTPTLNIMPRFFALLAFLFFAAAPAVAQYSSLYADPKAQGEGDLLTIVLAEQTSASRESAYNNASSSALGGSGSVSSPSLSGTFGANASFNMEGSDRNRSSQRELLTGTVTARVVEVDPAGNLVIAGERKLQVNGVTHLMKITGVVRPLDVRYDNTVLSFQIANANIEYRHDGLRHRFLRPGFLALVGSAAVLVGAILLGGSN